MSSVTPGALRARRLRREQNSFEKKILPWTFLTPLLAVVVGVVGYPVVRTIWLSFHEGEYLQNGPFVGLQNYRDIFANPYYTAALLRTTLFAVAVVATTILLSLAIALVLDAAPRAAKVLSVIVLLPWAMPRVASGIVWKWMFDDQYGVVNWLLVNWFGIESFSGFSWFRTGTPAMVAITVAVVWHSVPFVAVSLFAGLRGTHGEVVEAARVDGANGWQILRHIRLPMIRPLLVVMTTISTIWAYQSFDHFLVMTTPPGGPNHSTEVLSLLTWLEAFAQLNQGSAAAMAVVLFLMLAAVSVLYVRLNREDAR
ncbi:carbohydrate ABC transporter permease [Dactylosporangium fulvum]|uniref:Sugar ABC transporter permease n=1 Tax=Dactylosporangium fulvum TaxID=53359 RepID=A0ABY5VS84_9ACTN|nr:sugar ABC transporter permease [Dactylosporangium fulvum]UWP80145.1 sugar ABC transporter permease [Dactylosporangium fulvum]